MHDIVFWIFASTAVLAAIFVIGAKNPIRAVFSLIVVFLATGVSWLLLNAEFLAFTLILVYVGAVMVLFLFVVMMLDIKFATLQARFTKWLPIGLLLAGGLFCAIVDILSKTDFTPVESTLAYNPDNSNIRMLAELIFTKYLLQFEIAGTILLVAIVAAIGLIFRGPQQRKVQRISKQIDTKPSDRIRLENL